MLNLIQKNESGRRAVNGSGIGEHYNVCNLCKDMNICWHVFFYLLVLYECAYGCDCFKLFFVFKGVTFPMHLVYHYATIKTSDVRNLSGRYLFISLQNLDY